MIIDQRTAMKHLIFLLSVFITLPVFGQVPLQPAVDAFVSASVFEHASIGIAVIDVKNGRMIASHAPQRSLTPASILKLVTTSSALALLGPDFQYKTELQYDGQIQADGVLQGNLYLKGYGDPTLGSDQMEEVLPMQEVLERFRIVVQQQGVRKIGGFVVGDDSYWGTAANIGSWQWADIGNYYGAGTWGLNMHENLYYLTFRQTRKLGATPPVLHHEPELPDVLFINELTNAKTGRGGNAYIYGAPYSYVRHIRGTIGVGSGTITIKGAIPDPPHFAAYHFQKSLNSIGIEVQEGAISQQLLTARGQGIRKRQTLYTHNSPTLAKIVYRANQKSVNLYCETMLRTIGKIKGKDDAVESGLEAIQEYWSSQGLDFDGVFLKDGSGLSPRNSVSAAFFARLLQKAAQNNKTFSAFEASLPLAGRSGILENRLKGTRAENNLRAKSGTMERVRSYAGYTRNTKGELLAFCIIVNNYSGSGSAVRQKMEQLMLQFCR